MSVSSSSSQSSSDFGSSSPAPATASGDLEFRCTADGAWYNARVVLEGDKLTVKYLNFGDEEDEVFSAADFRSPSELREFEERIRPVSAQLQDRECGNVIQGTVVCASLSVTDSDIRFYDAVVDDVIYKEHSFNDGEEECLCTFVVVWLHGPRTHCFDNRKIEHLCLVQSGKEVDSAVPLFLDIVARRLDSDLCYLLDKDDHYNGDARTKQLLISQETESGKQQSARIFPLGERLITFSERNEEDVDFGGEDAHLLLLIDNMDKELLPSIITKFIHRETSVSAQAYIFPSLSSETYTRGVIILDSKEDLKEVKDFLSSPTHVVVSSKGRPWVLKGTLSGSNAFEMPDRRLMLDCQCTLHRTSNAMDHVLKVVHVGTEEYNIAKHMKKLFEEFAAHQQRLHSSLALEEGMILQAYNGVQQHSSLISTK